MIELSHWERFGFKVNYHFVLLDASKKPLLTHGLVSFAGFGIDTIFILKSPLTFAAIFISLLLMTLRSSCLNNVQFTLQGKGTKF